MERVEASLHGWPQAPYTSARSRWTPTSSAWSSTAAGPSTRAPSTSASPATTSSTSPTASSCAPRTAWRRWSSSRCSRAWPTTRRARCRRGRGGLLLYAPVVKAEDFHSAIAYLVRRLDENTAQENFLRHVFELDAGLATAGGASATGSSPRFGSGQRRRDAPRRTQDRRAEARARAGRPRDADAPVRRTSRTPTGRSPPTAPGSTPIVRRWRERPPGRRSRSQIGGEHRGTPACAGAAARSVAPGTPWPTLCPRRTGRGRSRARRRPGGAAVPGRARSAAERAPCWTPCAAELGRRRGDLIGAMILDGAKTVPEADAEVSEAIDFAATTPELLRARRRARRLPR